MSDMRRLIESMDNIMEIDMRSTRAGQRGLDVPNIEGGIGGGGGGGSISTGLGSAVGKALPKVWKNPRTGQTSSTPPAGVPPKPTPQPLPAGAIAKPTQQPLPAGVQPGTAGAGRGTVNPTAKDPLGRREPGFAPVDGRTPPIKPPEEKITKGDVAKSVAGHAALAAALYQGDKQEPGQPKGGGGGGESGDPAGSPPPVPPQADLYKPEDLKVLGIEPGSIDIKDPDIKLPSSNVAKPVTTTSSEIDVPKVGPQGPNSPFVVTKPEIVKPQPQPIPQIQPQPQAATPPINRPQTRPSISPSTSDILGRMQGAGSGGTGGNTGSTGAGGAGGGGGGGVGSGQGPGSGAGAGPGTGGGSVGGSGTGSSTAPSNSSGSDDPFPMMRHKLKRTNEHRSVNKLVKEFKRFVNRKI